MFILHKRTFFNFLLLLYVTKSVLGVLTSFINDAIIATYYFICNARCNMAFIASKISVAILCAILGLVVLLNGSELNSAESCAMPCKTAVAS